MLFGTPTLAQGSREIAIDNTDIRLQAYESIYNGSLSLVIQLTEGKVPINAPAKRLTLLSDANNNFKNYRLKQISPGKFVTIDNITISDSVFKLKFAGYKKLDNIEINFKDPKSPSSTKQ